MIRCSRFDEQYVKREALEIKEAPRDILLAHGMLTDDELRTWFSSPENHRVLEFGTTGPHYSSIFNRRRELVEAGVIGQKQAGKIFCVAEAWSPLPLADQRGIVEFLYSDDETPASPRVAALLDVDWYRQIALRVALETCANFAAPGSRLKDLAPPGTRFEVLAEPVLQLAVDSDECEQLVDKDFDNRAGWRSAGRFLGKLFRNRPARSTSAVQAGIFERWHRQRMQLKHGWFDKLPDQLMRNDGQRVLVSGAFLQWTDRVAELKTWVSDTTRAFAPVQVLESSSFNCYSSDLRTAIATWLTDLWELSPRYRLIIEVQQEFNGAVTEADAALSPPVVSTKKAGVEAAITDPKPVADKIQRAANALEELPQRLAWPSTAIPNLPRVLIVDDELGRIDEVDEEGNYVLSERARSSLLVQRGGFCRRFRLFDEEAAATAATGNIARGRFVPGQSYKGGVFRNDPSAIDKAIDEMGEDCALILMDLRFCEGEPDENGLSHDVTLFGLNWLENHKEACRIPVVAVTAEKSKEVIARVRACGAYLHRYSSGASDLVHHVLREERGTAEQRRNMMGIPFDFVAQSPAMMRMLQDVYDAGNDPRYPTLLLLGGTGSGKSELAKLIHELSGRQLTSPRSGEWQRLDCSLLTRELAQSQLFGHYKGAFTGGDATVKGAFQRANNGTLFLDEVGKLPDSVQPILYRAMEGPTSRRVATPLGSRKEGDETLDGEFNVRLIFATNEPTKKLDRPFLGRIQRTIRVPELWDRQEDILPLANLFLARLSVDVSSDDRAKNDDRINVDKKAADKDNAEIKRILMHEGRPRLRLDEHAEEFLLQQFSVRDEHDRNIRMLEALLAEAARGKGRINLIRRSDLEAAWRGTDAKFKYAGSERRNEPPSEVTSDGTVQNGLRTSGLAGGRAAQRLYEAAESSAGLVGLTVAEQRAIAGALYGKSFNLIGAVAAFAFLNCLDAKSAGIYLTGETINSGEAQGILQRLLKMHPQVAARVRALVPELSGRDKESDDGKAVLARLLDEAEEEFERRQGTGPPKKGRPATESNK